MNITATRDKKNQKSRSQCFVDMYVVHIWEINHKKGVVEVFPKTEIQNLEWLGQDLPPLPQHGRVEMNNR